MPPTTASTTSATTVRKSNSVENSAFGRGGGDCRVAVPAAESGAALVDGAPVAPAELVVLAAEEPVEAGRSYVVTALLVAKAVVKTGVAVETSEASGVSAIERNSESGAEEADRVRNEGETR